MVLTDITEQKRAELERQMLRDKAEMAGRLAAVGEMAAGIAHEINNPLTGVIGFAELLLDRGDLPEDVRDDLKVIDEGSQRVKDIVRRLLTFARQAKPFKSSSDINEVLDRALELRSYVLETSNIKVVKDYDPEIPWISIDPGQMQQVFLNLIVNAEYSMKKAHGRGTLILKTDRNEDFVRVTVTDDGLGLTDEAKAKLFQPFFTTKDPGEGTGLGLALSLGIIQEHSGMIQAKGAPGQGASFVIDLPIAAEESSGTLVEPPTGENTGITRPADILVIDDEPAVRSLVTAALSKAGHRVEACEKPEDAREKIGRKAYDIVFVDLRMPGMSGIELRDEIIKLRPEQAPGIVFITGDTSDQSTREYLAAHQVPFIAKPFDRNALLKMTEWVLRGKPGNGV